MSVTMRPYRGRQDQWEVDIRIAKLPDGKPYRERIKAPVTGKSAAKRWGEARELAVLRDGRPKEVEEEELTLSEFFPKFVQSHLEANRLKPSHQLNVKCEFNAHLGPVLGKYRLSEITS